jgi:hypothetical protein
LVVRSQPNTNEQSCAFPRIVVLPNGRWLAGFRATRGKQDEELQSARITWSDDQGKTWSVSTEPFAPKQVDGKSGRWRAVAMTPLGGSRVLATLNWADGSIPGQPLFNPETEGVQDLRIFTSVSRDNGQTWSIAKRIVEKPYENIPLSITGPTLVMPDGSWGCQFELNKTYNDTGPWHQAAVMSHSKDQGETWLPAVDVARDPDLKILHWDQRPQVLSDGSVISLFWTFDKSKGDYLNMHAARSTDSGRTWGKPWDIGVPGQPAPLVDLGNGRLALVYVDRTGVPAIKLRISRDGARTFPATTEILVHQRAIATQTINKQQGDSADAWAEMAAFSIGLPDAVRLGDNEVLVVYYTGPNKDNTDIEWARVKVSP